MMSKMNLTEATMLALQGKLELKESAKRPSKVSKKTEAIDVNVDDTTSVSVDENTTVVETPEATVIITEPSEEIVAPEEVITEPVETVEIPVDSEETIMPDDILETPVETELPVDEPSIEEIVNDDVPLETVEEPATDVENEEEKEESKKVESKEQPVKEARQRTTKDVYVIQGNYGQGWEDVVTYDNRQEARDDLKSYKENEPEYSHRLITRREKLNESADAEPNKFNSLLAEVDNLSDTTAYKGICALIVEYAAGVVGLDTNAEAMNRLNIDTVKSIADNVFAEDSIWETFDDFIYGQIYSNLKLEESKKLQEVDERAYDLAEKIAEEIRKSGCMNFQDIVDMIAKLTGEDIDTIYEKQLDNDVYGCLSFEGIICNYSTGDFCTDEYAEEHPEVLEESKKLENVNIEISEDGKEVEVTTDDGEVVETIDETPDEVETEEPTEEPIEEGKQAEQNEKDITSKRIEEVKAKSRAKRSAKYEEMKARHSTNKTETAKVEETKVKAKVSSKSFNEALTKYFTENFKVVESVNVTKILQNEKALKVEATIKNKNGSSRNLNLVMNKVQEGKTFNRYELKQAKGLVTEAVNKDKKLTMMTVTNKQNVLECRYVINK